MSESSETIILRSVNSFSTRLVASMNRKISERNLVRYNMRDEAIQDGKKPCHDCNP
jgi:hypothetical protein